MADDVESGAGSGGPKFRAREDTSTAPSRFWPGSIWGWGGTPPAAPNEVDDVDGKRLPVKATIAPDTINGYDTFHRVTTGDANAVNIKASAGKVYAIGVFNNAGYPIFVKLHNTAGAPTAGVGVFRTFGVQAGTHVSEVFPHGITFSAGIAMTVVKGIADTDTTAVVASDGVIDVHFK